MAILPEGADSDSKLAEVRACLNKLRELQAKLDNSVQVKSARHYTEDLGQMFDPMNNPSEYRLCQDEAVRASGQEILLANASYGKDDALRSISLDTLARLCFGNAAASEVIASSRELLSVYGTALETGVVPEKLSALQLGQAIAASPGTACTAVVPALVAEAVRLLSDNGKFDQLSQGSLDLLVSCSFSSPDVVASALGWQQLSQLLSEGEMRPAWLPNGPLEILVCGLLAINCLDAAEPGEVAQAHRDDIVDSLSRGRFLEYFVECLQAAVTRHAWPEESNAFHSPQRLAEAARKLARLGFRKELLPAVTLLAQVAEGNDPRLALLALKELSSDVHCLEQLLSLDDFRKGTLEALHKSGEEPAATDLTAYLEFVEHALVAGQAAKDLQKAACPQAPAVLRLAEIFGHYAQLDGKMDLAHLAHVCAEVPLVPGAAVRSSLSSSSDGGLSLQSFLEHAYGTRSILGWWPSLMEDATAARHVLGDVPRLPSMVQAAAIFAAEAEGRTSMSIQALYDKALPALGIVTEGAVLETKFSELNGSAPLKFPDFMKWLGELCIDLAEAEAEALAAEAEVTA